MDVYIIVCLFIFGVILGSFYNVVGLRVPVGESIIRPRSHCSACKRDLGSLELIPVLSYFVLKGKCRACHTRISFLYPLVEFLTGVLFVLSYVVFGWSGEMAVSLVLMSLFMIIFVSDIRYMLIPDKILLFFSVLFIILRMIHPLAPWWDSLAGAMIGFSLLLFIAFISRGGMGGGDIKLFAVLGFVLGWKAILLTFFFSSLYGAIFGGAGLLLGLLERKKPIPFGPFIMLGTITSYFFGEALITWYISRIL